MENIEYEVKENILNIKVDVSQEIGLSSSGKNIMIASTEGNQTVDTPFGKIKMGINIYKKKEDKKIKS